MTLDDMRKLDREHISIREASLIIGCDPNHLRDMLDIDDAKPIEMRRFRFPYCKIGNRWKIVREGFIRWADGTMFMGGDES